MLFKQKTPKYNMNKPPSTNLKAGAVGVLEPVKKRYLVHINQGTISPDKPTKLSNSPLEHIAEVEIQIKLKNDLPQTHILPTNGVEFCELLSRDSICNGERYRDTNCFKEKANGCNIYQRYSKILRIFKRPKFSLKLLKISDYLLPIHKG